jgi:hypothetical protein
MYTRPDAADSDQKSVSICGCRKEFWPRIDTDETAIRDCSIRSKLSLQCSTKFREEMGKGLRLGLPGTTAHKPKTRKGNHIMKNRNMQFKPSARLLIPLLLTCFAAVFILAPTPAAARDMVPFNGTVSGYVESQSGTECEPSAHVINFGHANQLGAFTGTADFVTHPCDPDPDLCENNIPYTGTFDWFAANGDEIFGTFEGYLCPTETPGVYDNHETAEVTGGTGRFANATGHFELAGQLDFTTNPPSFVLPWQGVISSLGPRRH